MAAIETHLIREVVTVDESGSTVYLIEAGKAEVIGAGGPSPVTLGPGDTFGEIVSITVMVTGDEVVRLPTASRATAVRVWVPAALVALFQDTTYGAVVASAPRFTLWPGSARCRPWNRAW